MLFTCDHCELFYRDPGFTRCPLCGGLLMRESRTEQQLLNDGFEAKDFQISSTSTKTSSYADLQAAFEQQHTGTFSPKPPAPTVDLPTPHSSTVPTHKQTVSPVDPVPPVYHIPDIPDDPFENTPPVSETPPIPTPSPQPTPAPFRSVTPHLNINWSLIGRIVLIVSSLLFVAYIWSIRYVILNGIVSFLLHLLPPILLIVLIVQLIKYIFRS